MPHTPHPDLDALIDAVLDGDLDTARQALVRHLDGAPEGARVEAAAGWARLLAQQDRPDEADALLARLLTQDLPLRVRTHLHGERARLAAQRGDREAIRRHTRSWRLGGALPPSTRLAVAADLTRAWLARTDPVPHGLLLAALADRPEPSEVQGAVRLAWDVAREAGEVLRARGDREGEAWSAHTLALLALGMGQGDTVRPLAEHTARLALDLGHPILWVEAHEVLLRLIDDPQRQRDLLARATRRWAEAGHDGDPLASHRTAFAPDAPPVDDPASDGPDGGPVSA